MPRANRTECFARPAHPAALAESRAINCSTPIDSGELHDKDERRYQNEARSAEVARCDALGAELGSAPPKRLGVTYPPDAFGTRMTIATLGVALGTAVPGPDLGAVTAPGTNAVNDVATAIAATESQHLCVVMDVVSNNPIGPAFPGPPSAATAAVSGCIA